MIAEAAVRGTQFRPIEAKAFVNTCEDGVVLTLQREPENPHDANAIKVLSPDPEAIHIGYIAKEIAAEIAPLMDSGQRLVAVVSGRMSASMLTVEINPDDNAPASDETTG